MNSKKHIQWLSLLIVFLVTFGFGQNAWAADITWAGTTSTVWGLAGNWSPAQIPTASDNVIIPNGTANDPQIGAGYAAVAASLTVAGDGNISFAAGAGTLTVSGNATFSGTSATALVLTASTAATPLTINGDLTISSTATITGTSETIVITGNVSNAGTILITGATVTIGGSITNTGTFTTDNTTDLTLNGSTDVTIPDAVIALNNLTVTKTGAGKVYAPTGSDLAITTALTINSGKYYVASGRITTATATLTLANTAGVELIVGSGTLVIGNAATFGALSSLTTTSSSTLTVGSGAGNTAVTLPDEVTTLKTLTINKGAAADDVYLSSDLTLSNSGGNVLVITQGQLQPVASTTVDITISTGNISVAATGTLARFNLTGSNGEMNLIFNGTSTVTVAANATGTLGLNVTDITLNDATVSTAGDFITFIYGDLTLNGTSAITPAVNTAGTLTFTSASTQNIIVADDSYLELVNLSVAANTTVLTSDNFSIREVLTLAAATSVFTASAGTATFNPSGAAVLWANAAPGVLTLNDVIVNCGTANGTPATNIIVTGDFTKIGTNNLAATAGTVTFTNSNLAGKTLQIVGGTDNLFNIAVSAGSKLNTSSTFTLNGTGGAAITIGSNSELIAEAGTITISGAAASISNSGTLEFNNLAIAATALNTTTTSDFTIKGTFACSAPNAQFVASTPSTITFSNSTEKAITNSGTDQTDMTFFNLTVAASSDITTATSITVNGDLELEADAEFTFTANTAYFNGGLDQDVIVADDANMSFFNIVIGNVGVTNVSTTDNFSVTGSGAANFAVNGATDKFIASSPSVVTFSTNNANITADNNANGCIFYDLTISNITLDFDAGADVNIRGDLNVNGASGLVTSTATAQVTFDGDEEQLITGTSTQTTPVTFDDLVINKDETTLPEANVTMELNAALINTSALTLTNGFLNINNKKLTINGTTVTSTNGRINGGTGTIAISTNACTWTLSDALFTLDHGDNTTLGTLYNLEVGVAETIDGNLLINGGLDVTAAVALTIAASTTVTVMGDLDNSGAGTIVGTAAATSVLKLSGTGSASDLDDAFLATMPSLTFERGEVLTGNITMVSGNVLTINTSTQYLDLNGYDLDLNADNTIVLNRASGGIDASATGSGVILNTHISQATIPANLFKNNIVQDLTIGGATVLGGDLTINGTLTGLFQITTNNNTLTFGPSATLPAYVAGTHIVGNLRRTVTNTAKTFPIGGGASGTYTPVSLQFANAGSSQIVKVSSQAINPVYGRGGDPTKAMLSVWTITPEGTAPSDSVAIHFGVGTNLDNGLTADVNTFAARWNTSSWVDYRNGYALIASSNFDADQDIATKALNYPVNANTLTGEWAVFVPASSSTTDKDAAIAVSNNKLVIKNVTPSSVEAGIPFSVTIELQNQYGNPTAVSGTIPLTLAFADLIGSVTGIGTIAAVIPVGSSSVTVNGFSYASATAGNQFKVTGSGPTSLPNPGLSPLINVIAGLPSNQVHSITLGGGTTSTTLDFTLTTDYGIIIAKAGSAITSADYPTDGVTYYASSNFGEGSKIGDAVVVYKGQDPSAFTVSGLSPKTTYYFRGFSYGSATTAGTEKYLTFASANNPKNFTTGGSATYDDDTDFGTNNTIATAKPIGANSPIKGTIKTTDDVDWFSFTITNSAPNLRARLTLSANLGNYNVELYNVDGRRLRRGTRLTNNNENQVINELEPGTYLVKVVGVDGAFDASNYYTLQLTTDGSEIYSVTE